MKKSKESVFTFIFVYEDIDKDREVYQTNLKIEDSSVPLNFPMIASFKGKTFYRVMQSKDQAIYHEIVLHEENDFNWLVKE